MRVLLVAAAVGVTLASARLASADVQLTIVNGNVTLSAQNATVPQILAEWGRVGQTRIVNGERVAGAPLTMELKDIPETQALDIILRAVSGYVLAPRVQAASASVSKFDRIYIVPTNAAPRPAPTAAPPPPTQAFQPPRFAPPPPPPDDLQDDVPVGRQPAAGVAAAPGSPAAADPGARPQPGFMVFPTQPQAPQGGSYTAPPSGVPVPGMVVPTPTPQNRDIRANTPTPQ